MFASNGRTGAKLVLNRMAALCFLSISHEDERIIEARCIRLLKYDELPTEGLCVYVVLDLDLCFV